MTNHEVGNEVVDRMVRKVNRGITINDVARYIYGMSRKLEAEDAKRIAYELVVERKYSAKGIINGHHNRQVKTLIDQAISRRNNIKKEEAKVEEKKVPLETKKVKKSKVTLKRLMAASLAIAIAGTGVNYAVKKGKEVKLDKGISKLVSNEYTLENENMIEQSFREVQDIVYANSFEPVNENELEQQKNDLISKKIGDKILSQIYENPELFDALMYNAFVNLENNYFEYMDGVLKYIKESIAFESLPDIYSKIEPCEVFLDYIVSRGFLNPNSNDYYIVLKDIETYKNLAPITTHGCTYDVLTKDAKERIDALADNYRKNGIYLYDEYKDDIERLNGENFGR